MRRLGAAEKQSVQLEQGLRFRRAAPGLGFWDRAGIGECYSHLLNQYISLTAGNPPTRIPL